MFKSNCQTNIKMRKSWQPCVKMLKSLAAFLSIIMFMGKYRQAEGQNFAGNESTCLDQPYKRTKYSYNYIPCHTKNKIWYVNYCIDHSKIGTANCIPIQKRIDNNQNPCVAMCVGFEYCRWVHKLPTETPIHRSLNKAPCSYHTKHYLWQNQLFAKTSPRWIASIQF